MSRSARFVGAVAACLLLPMVARADTAATEGRRAAETWDRAYNGGDMEALGKLYAPDARVIPKGAAVSGPADIQAFFTGLKAKGFDDHRITVHSARGSGDVLVLSGRWQMTGPGGEGGAKKAFEGNWVNVLERSGDGWRTVLHTWN